VARLSCIAPSEASTLRRDAGDVGQRARLGTKLGDDAARHEPGHATAEDHGQRERRQHDPQETTRVAQRRLVLGLDAGFLEVDQLVDGGQPFHVLRFGLVPQQFACGWVGGGRLLHDGACGRHRLVLDGLDAGVQACQLRRRARRGDQLFQRGHRVRIERGQCIDGLDFLLAIAGVLRQHHVAQSDRTVVCRAPEVDGVALDEGVLLGIRLQCGVDRVHLEHGDHRDHEPQA
jgi:hypothetical protein